MTFASSLLAKLLIAATVITPATGYGGYCLYEYCTSSSFDKQITQQGYRFSPISLENNSSFLQDPSKFYEKLEGDWRCTKQLFGSMPLPKTDANSASEKDVNIPSATTVSANDSESDSVGCLVTDLGHTKDGTSKAAFLKWELALRSGNRGFIYIGDFSAEKTGTSAGSHPYQTSNMIFEAVKGNSGWNIKSGVYWKNVYSDSTERTVRNTDSGSSSAKITFLNNKSWESGDQMCLIGGNEENDKCGGKEKWEFERYISFWSPETDGTRVIDAVNIEVKKGSKTYKHDVWSNDEFDFETTKANSDNTPFWKSSLDYVYEVDKKDWGKMQTGTSAESYLKAIYSPWAKKKGTWTQATENLCSEMRAKNPAENTPEGRKLVNFCYQKS